MMAGNYKKLVALMLCLMSVYSQAQQFAQKALLDAVPENGFYRIRLSPQLTAGIKSDLSDIRIRDEQKRTVPFVLQQQAVTPGSAFIDFPILSNATDSNTLLALDARTRQGTDHLSFIMGNTAVERFASLSGSYDRRQWFIISEQIRLTNESQNNNDRFVQSVRFPFVRYPYLKLVIHNKGTDPLNILQAGTYADTATKNQLDLDIHAGTTYLQKDSSDGMSYIRIHNQAPYPVSRVSLSVSGPKFYKRPTQIYGFAEGRMKEFLASFELVSGKDAVGWLPGSKSQDLLLLITNGDNPPLKITSVRTEGAVHYLIAYLEKGKEYHLLAGSRDASLPRYDLSDFRDSIPAQLATLKYGPVVAAEKEDQKPAADFSKWLWPSIIVMMLVLGLLTYRLMSDIKKKGV